MIEGVDYAWSRPSPKELYALGKRFACRYLSYDDTGKNLSRTEAQVLNTAGLYVVANWEWGASDAKRGRSIGVLHAKEAQIQARACGMPENRPIYFSVDFDVQFDDFADVADYFVGVESVLGKGRVGVYGGIWIVQYLARQGLAQWFWQTYAWSSGSWYTGNHIEQYRNGVMIAGQDCDLDRARQSDYGQWTVDGKGMAAMTISSEDRAGVAEAVWHYKVSSRELDVENRTAIDWLKQAQATENMVGALQTGVREIMMLLKGTIGTIDPHALVDALVSNPTALDALATAIAARVGMIPTAREIGKSVIEEYKRVLSGEEGS